VKRWKLLSSYLSVEGKLVEFKVFQKASFDASSLVDCRLSSRVEYQRLPDRLLRLAETVLDVQLRVPELLPLDVFDVLQRLKLRKYHTESSDDKIPTTKTSSKEFWIHTCIRHLEKFLQLYTVSQKNKQNYFSYNYAKLPPNLIIFGTEMANSLKLYEVHSFSTSPNSCQCTILLNANVPKCYITL